MMLLSYSEMFCPLVAGNQSFTDKLHVMLCRVLNEDYYNYLISEDNSLCL